MNKLARLSVVVVFACMLPSCGSETTSTPSDPSPPAPTPSTPANVTATMTVTTATAASAFDLGALEQAIQVTLQTIYTNAGTEDAMLGDGLFQLFLDGGGVRTRTRSGGQTVPGSGQLTVEDTFFVDVVVGGTNTTITEADQLRSWLQSNDPANAGTIVIDPIPVPGNLVVPDTRPCVSSATRLCLHNDRFSVQADWRDFTGNTGVATVIPGSTFDEGEFWFFSPNNTELVVKVLDACADNGHFWVFAASTTNVETTLTVTDTSTGLTQNYGAPLGTASPAITDTQAFATCPAPVPVPVPVP